MSDDNSCREFLALLLAGMLVGGLLWGPMGDALGGCGFENTTAAAVLFICKHAVHGMHALRPCLCCGAMGDALGGCGLQNRTNCYCRNTFKCKHAVHDLHMHCVLACWGLAVGPHGRCAGWVTHPMGLALDQDRLQMQEWLSIIGMQHMVCTCLGALLMLWGPMGDVVGMCDF
jgi:hypothetical protein